MGVASSAVFYSGAWIHPLSDPWTEFPQGQDVQDEGDRGWDQVCRPQTGGIHIPEEIKAPRSGAWAFQAADPV